MSSTLEEFIEEQKLFFQSVKEVLESQPDPVNPLLLDGSCFPFSELFKTMYLWRNYGDVDPPFVSAYLQAIQLFPREGFCLTSEVFQELLGTKDHFREKISYFNSKEKLRLRKGYSREKDLQAKELMENLGLELNEFIKKVKLRQVNLKNPATIALEELLAFFIENASLRIQKKQDFWGGPPRKYAPKDSSGDESLVVASLYYSLVEERPVSLLSADTDLVKLLYVPINVLIGPSFSPENEILHLNLYRHAITLYIFNQEAGTYDICSSRRLQFNENFVPRKKKPALFIAEVKEKLRVLSDYAQDYRQKPDYAAACR